MRKANQKSPAKVLSISESEYQNTIGYLDRGARKRSDFENNINRNVQHCRTIEQQIVSLQDDLRRRKQDTKKLTEQLAELPPSTFTIDDFKSLIAKIAALPWVASVGMANGYLVVGTRQGVLKTDFYNRMVIGNRDRVVELLPEILTLPLPTYELRINLANMGSTWARQENNLAIRMSDPLEWNSFAASGGSWVHEPHSHWATNRHCEQWADLCLGDYESVLIKAGKEGLMEFLQELVIYLQSSGWSGAYRNKMAWAILLGNPLYNKHLLRDFVAGETIDEITTATRTSMDEWLKKNNLTSHEYYYGSRPAYEHGDDEEDRMCFDCDCEEEGEQDDDCECDCHG